MEKQRKQFSADLTVAEGERSFTAVITAAVIDRDGEVLLPEGMRSVDFEKNPVVFWNHDYNTPIGKATGLKRHRDKWEAKAVLSSTPFASEIHTLMQEGVVNGVSVGFQPIESRNPSAKDKDLFGEDVKRVHSKWDLFEFSVTPLPANQNALVTAVSKGITTPDRVKALFGVDVEPEPARAAMVVVPPFNRKRTGPTQADLDVAVQVAVARRLGKIYV